MTENNKILVTDFIKKYNTLTNDNLKNNLIKSIIKRTYCPVIEKRMILNLMLEKSVTKDNTPYIDMFVNKLNFYAAVISLYTYIVPNKDENDKPKSYEMYDLLMENNLINPILEEIGEKEVVELTSINGLLLDTWHMKNSSPEAYVANLVETASQRFGIVAGTGMEKLTELLEDEKKVEKIMSTLDKMLHKIK